MALENALRKARAALRPGAREAVLGCDTIVTLDGVIYGKPPDAAVARRTLTALGGRTHEVISGLADVRLGRRMREPVTVTSSSAESSLAGLLTEVSASAALACGAEATSATVPRAIATAMRTA